jgi:hypothetical protein
MQFYIKTINQWSDTLSKAAADGVAKIAQSFDLAKLSTNFQSSAQDAAKEMTSAMQNIPSLEKLGNETNKAFASRLKDSLSDQSIDFTKMTEDSQKELAKQLGMTVENAKMFLSDSIAAPSNEESQNQVTPMISSTAAPEVAAAAVEAETRSTVLQEERSPVKFDTENLKKEIIEAIKDGFAAGNYGFNLSLDGKSIATSLQLIQDYAGRRIQFVG